MTRRSSYTPEQSYREALSTIRLGDYESAARLFRKTIDLDRGGGETPRSVRSLSYYGLCLAMQGQSKQIATEACRKALSARSDDPILHLNLGRVYVVCGKTTAAIKTYQHGLLVAPGHVELRRALEHIDRRSSPVISLLPRSNILNRWLGRSFRSGRDEQDQTTAQQ